MFVRNKGNIVDVSENATICGSKLCMYVDTKQRNSHVYPRHSPLTVYFINSRNEPVVIVVFNETIDGATAR